jgi:hypothetical protein
MIRVPFVRIAEQLPVEMFTRGRDGLNDTLRPGVSLLVPRNLLLPHLGEALAPVRWEIVADQFPLDELALTHEEIADRLPDGSLLLPLDEVIPQIPARVAGALDSAGRRARDRRVPGAIPAARTDDVRPQPKPKTRRRRLTQLAEADGVAPKIEAPADAGPVAVEPTLEHEAVTDVAPEPNPDLDLDLETAPDPDLVIAGLGLARRASRAKPRHRTTSSRRTSNP